MVTRFEWRTSLCAADFPAIAYEALCLRVTDEGPGVSAEALEHIFTPFYTSKAEGLGLGLSMSRSIIEGFGGALEARPAAGGGLVLECRLPLGRTEQQEELE